MYGGRPLGPIGIFSAFSCAATIMQSAWDKTIGFAMKKVLAIQRRLDGVEQRIFAKRLAQKIHCTSGDGLPPFVLGHTGGDKDDRNLSVCARQVSLQFQAVDARHPKVEY
jgi:hypothetical protein